MNQEMTEIDYKQKLNDFLNIAIAAEATGDLIEAGRYLRLALLCEARLQENMVSSIDIDKTVPVRLPGKTVY